MAFKAVIEAGRLQDFFRPLTALEGDAIPLVVGPDGFESIAIDPGHLVVAQMRLRKQAFVDIEGTPMRLWLPTTRFAKVLDALPQESAVKIASGDGNTVTLEAAGIRSIIRNYVEGAADPKIPDLAFTTGVKVPLGRFLAYIRFLHGLKVEIVTVSYDPAVGLFCTGTKDEDDHELRLQPHELQATDRSGPVEATRYTPEVLARLLGLKTFNGELMSLQFADDFPIRIEAPFTEGNGELVLLVAPRIDESRPGGR